MDALIAVDAMDDLIHNAPKVFLSDDVRIDPVDIAELLGHVRAGLLTAVPDTERSASWELLLRLEAIVRDAPAARLARGVRLDPDEVYDLLDQLRATAPEDIRRGL